MLKYIQKIIGTKNERELKKLWPVVERINALEPEFEALSDEALRGKTDEFRKRFEEGESLDDLLPEAFATVREVSRRTTGMRHFDVQLIGGIVLHQGKIAEMKTGEGKTLVATLALYLNGLTGKGAHLVTVNDYLARRDVQWMGPIYHALGLTTSSIVHDASFQYDPTYIAKDYRFQWLRPVSRKEAYSADITYGTNNELGFDYLRDNMKFDLADYVQRDLHYAIVDEVDNILIDEARTPLIISGPSEASTEEYVTVNRIIPKLQRDADYTIDEKLRQVMLTEDGVAKVERLLNIPNLYDPEQINMLHHVIAGLRAHAMFKRDVHYVVKDGQVIIVDEFTGRLMPGRRWSDGLHQAVEAKEGVPIQRENQTLATITIQNFFRMYDKLAGMTGTADTEAVEFQATYNLDVAVIPTNRPLIREELPDLVYRTEKEKFDAVIADIQDCNDRGQPVLVGTISVQKSEKLSKLLRKARIQHNVLNATNHELEASVIAQAGRRGAVTIATNMAGRGTDILLGGNPDFLARTEMENEWMQKVAKLANPEGGTGKRYEDSLRELRENYEEELEAIRGEYDPKLADLDERRKDALRRETEIRQRLLEESPIRPVRERYERTASADLIPAIGDRRPISRSYVDAKGEFDSALEQLAGDGGGQLLDEFVTVRERLAEYVEEWSDPQRRMAERLAEDFNSTRVHYDRVRNDLELEVLMNGGMSSNGDLAGQYRQALEERQALEREHHDLEGPYQQALARASERYEERRQEYVQAMGEIREQLEAAPQEFEGRFQEILEHYKGICSEERETVVQAGGLHIIGTERHESRRIDNQLRGRAGRQGDPGSSRFYLSLEDDLLRIFGAERIQGLMGRLGMEEGVPIEHKMIDRAVTNAQSKVEAQNFDIRKHLLEYDDVMNKQREVVYHRRRAILSGEGLREEVLEIAEGLAEDVVRSVASGDMPSSEWDWKRIDDAIARQFNVHVNLPAEEREGLTVDRLVDHVIGAFHQLYEEKERIYTPENMRRAEKFFMLQTLDSLWKDHLLSMDHLKEGVGLRGYGQRHPLQEYKKEGFSLFEAMMARFEEEAVSRLAHVQIVPETTVRAAARREQPAVESGPGQRPAEGAPAVAAASSEAGAEGASQQARNVLDRLEQRQRSAQPQATNRGPQPKQETVRREGEKVGRNDPCPCGSGKKYKKCHG